jgi:carbon-monoxide dehydrogenase small subunit
MSGLVEVTLSVNGRDYALHVEPRRTLLDAIRDGCGLTGTHMGCEHGVCGACTVLLDGEPIRACLMFRGAGTGRRDPHRRRIGGGRCADPVQRAFIAHHGVQCGFCTPGFLMLATGIALVPQRPCPPLARPSGPIRRARSWSVCSGF